MLSFWFFLLSFSITFIACFLLLPHYIKKAHQVSITGKDIHKPNSPDIAECGGIIIVLTYLIGLFTFIPFIGANLDWRIVGTAATVMLSSFVGFIDDVFETRWRVKVLTPIIGAVPLAVMQLGRTTMTLWQPFGVIDFGIWFYLAILPLIITACTNAVNMFAGVNGLEAGSTLIICLALTYLSLRFNKVMGLIILVPFLGALSAFLLFNKYPSRVFPGDVGTFGMGSVIACCAVLSDFERAVFVMFIPHIINAILFFIGKAKGEEPPREAEMNPDGTLPAPSIWSLRSVILRIRPMKEKELVYTLWLIVAFFAALGTLVYGI